MPSQFFALLKHVEVFTLSYSTKGVETNKTLWYIRQWKAGVHPNSSNLNYGPRAYTLVDRPVY